MIICYRNYGTCCAENNKLKTQHGIKWHNYSIVDMIKYFLTLSEQARLPNLEKKYKFYLLH